MLVIKTWCLPEMKEEQLQKLFQTILANVMNIPQLRVESERDMLCLFPSDMMKYGLGQEILVEVTGFPGSLELSWRTTLSSNLRGILHRFLPKARIILFVNGVEMIL